MLGKERLFEAFNLVHSYGRWEIKAQRDETTFPESKLLPASVYYFLFILTLLLLQSFS